MKSWDENKEKKRNDGGGGGGGERRKRSPTNAASDWCGAGSVDYQSKQVCFVYVRHRLGLI